MPMASRSWLRLLRPTSARFCTSTEAAAPVATPEAAPANAPAEIGVADFLKSIGEGVEAHVDKIVKEVPVLDQLLLIRRMKLKKIGVPCKHRKLILRFTEKYRQNLWRPKIVKS